MGFGLFGSTEVHLVYFCTVQFIRSTLLHSVDFSPVQSIRSSSVYISLLWSNSVDFGLIGPIRSTFICFSQVQSIESISVHQSISFYFFSFFLFFFFWLALLDQWLSMLDRYWLVASHHCFSVLTFKCTSKTNTKQWQVVAHHVFPVLQINDCSLFLTNFWCSFKSFFNQIKSYHYLHCTWAFGSTLSCSS